MAVKWILTDIDGCLSPDESVPWDMALFGQFAERVREANAGRGTLAPLTLCTGRPQPYVEVLEKILDIRVPSICENGAVLYSIADNRPRLGPGVTEEKLLQLRAVRAFLETEALPEHAGAVIQFGKEAQISVYCERVEVFAPIQRRVEAFAEANGGPALVINRSPYYLNISLAGVDKGNALHVLLDELGASHDEAAGVGDSLGDLALREAVGFFACPVNACAEIKEAADYVSPYPNVEGMLDILDRPEMQRGVESRRDD